MRCAKLGRHKGFFSPTAEKKMESGFNLEWGEGTQ